MTFYAVDSRRQSMRSTGIVNEVREWVDGPDGKRRPAEGQARDEDTGMPLWEVEVLYRQVAFGRESNTTGVVRWVPRSSRCWARSPRWSSPG